MKVKPLRCHSCGAPVAWYDVDDVGIPIVYCYHCFENEHIEQGEYVYEMIFPATIRQHDGWDRWVGIEK